MERQGDGAGGDVDHGHDRAACADATVCTVAGEGDGGARRDGRRDPCPDQDGSADAAAARFDRHRRSVARLDQLGAS